ncbi:putative transcriptional regulator YdeE [Sulfitobacter mediterraneus]|uniref:Putative transcriptional regulator YdeE n=2 Tax=Sulfitobacter mediterraneus TaxID=83219 RepID=A0A2T6CIN0_9RHOB|nr:Transcriptional regulator [Sulfitobacter mediterraneus KCTC 32188]PTX75359.1 putative transcriptional regulator YdeE [Sulfitobacter mediterraneus]
MMKTDAQPVELTTGEARTLVGMAGSFTADTRSEIPKLWQAFFAAGPDIAGAVPDTMYGVSFSHDEKGGFRYGVGLEVASVPDQLPEGFCEMHLSEGLYALRRVFGPMTDLPGQMDWMFCDWLPSSEYKLREGAVFERYGPDERNSPDAMAYELWLPVAAKE